MGLHGSATCGLSFGENGRCRGILLGEHQTGMAKMFQMMLEQGLLARDKLKTTDPSSSGGIFYQGKIETVRFFCRNILTNVFSRHISFQQEDTSALDIREEAF